MRPALLFAPALFAACSAQSAAAIDASVPVERIPLTVHAETGNQIFQVEIADSPEERQQGLMFRTAMGEHEGMLFLFSNEQQLSFWMKNTLIPLDMVFIKSDRTILGVVANAAPKTLGPRSVPGLSQFVLEINAGLAATLGIRAGQGIEFYAPLPRD